ncbi:sigma 54-interacting transcriptional regulator [Endozoicomonas sp.]|uniref:sigma 54-interacting transcriptional regulator n=1 Tax=Endozoicomonas sp. TaxID=1892382 RepID=UPI0028868A21|nr:sigma 54-interacting transcriptional regulator [Endozoicomonas sp.]
MQSTSRLMSIQSTVLRFVQVLSRMLNLDVEVVDDNLVRIAGTGPYSSNLGRPLTTGTNAFKSVISTRRHKVIERSGQDPECLMCSRRVGCREKAFLGVPVIFHGDCIGVISLVCFNEEQREKLLGNIDFYIESIENTAQLFIAKTMESIYHDKVRRSELMLKEVGEDLVEGLLELDSKGHCQHLNSAARKLLGIESNSRVNANSLINSVQVRPFGRSKEGNRQQDEYIIQVGDQEKLLPGKMLILDERRFLVLRALSPLQSSKPFSGNRTEMVGTSPAVKRLRKQIERMSSSPSSVLIRGESGSGKEVVARMIHESGNRADQPFVAINCAAIPEQLLESELFGYARGAFTGASSQGREGLVKKADGGTLFLDEIGDMPLHLQAKLLRVLDRREITPVGASSVIPVDIRVISATHQDVENLVSTKKFREDLFYRLNVIPLELPPLRDRAGDVVLLVDYFLEKHALALGVPSPGLSMDVMDSLNMWHWPGNIRELANTIEYLVNMAEPGESVTSDLLPVNIQKRSISSLLTDGSDSHGSDDGIQPLSLNLESMEKHLVSRALRSFGKSEGKQRVADELGIGIATLYRKIKKYDLEHEVNELF